MKFIYSLFIICALLFVNSSYSQSFNDTIITNEQDTIFCKITLVNDHNIFYQYKNKRRTKAGDISRDQVLSYVSCNPQIVEIINRPIYPKCDTCENWIVLKSGETIYYNIKVSFFDDQNQIAEGAYLKTRNSVTTLEINNISQIKWDGVFHNSLILSEKKRDELKKMNGLDYLNNNSFLSRTIIEGDLPLRGFYYFGSSIVWVGAISARSIEDIQYYIIKNNELLFIPSSRKGFKTFVLEYLADNEYLVSCINNKVLDQNDIVEIFKIYNKAE